MFLLNSVRRLQKLSDLYRWGALLQEFGVRGKPRSVEHDATLNVIQYAICVKSHHIHNSAFLFVLFYFY